MIDEDELRFVMDIDSWETGQLMEIINYCQNRSNWNIALSNPCFEIWLYLHKRDDVDKLDVNSCNGVKAIISDFDKGGYNVLNYIKLVKKAVNNAKQLDEEPESSFPKHKRTKIYKLVESVLGFVSQNGFNNFLDSKYPILLQEQQRKIADSKKRYKK